MPIFEFLCLQCHEYFEWLVVTHDEEVQLQCPQCNSGEFERVLSKTSYCVGNSAGEIQGTKSQTRTCSGGTCTTYDIPGPTK